MLKFMSLMQGEASYKVVNGPLDGRLIRIRARIPAWYRQEYADAPEFYESHVKPTIGLARCGREPIPADLLAELEEVYANMRLMEPGVYCEQLQAARWSPESGWKAAKAPSTLEEMPCYECGFC